MRSGLVLAWAGAIGVGFAALARHQWTPGVVAQGVRDAGAIESLGVSRGERGAVVLFAHPRCPCTPASVRALGDLTPRSGWGPGTLTLTIVFVRPGDAAGEGWEAGRARTLAGAIRGATIVELDESRARPLGVRTSGHVLAFDGTGRTVLDGGITPGRGHEGDCAGLTTLRALVREGAGRIPADVKTDVFGCALLDAAPTTPDESATKPACCGLGAGTLTDAGASR